MRRMTILPLAICGLALGGCAVPSTVRAPSRTGTQPFEHAAVAADHPLASEAGVEMLARGGNAVDAAVAASFCLSVVRPYSCGLGGGGFMVIYAPPDADAPARTVALNYRETAPAAVGRDYYDERLGDETVSRLGVHAVGVPGTVAGLLTALTLYGTLDRSTVLGPAIRAAEEGWTADASHVRAGAELAERLQRRPDLRESGQSLWGALYRDGDVGVGDVLRNPHQARALRLIAAEGREAFYAGPIADAIVAAMTAAGGPITLEDLGAYTVQVTEPLRGSFGGSEILAMPPPSSGGVTMLQILGLIERRLETLDDPAHNGPAYVHLVAESMKHAFADRAAWLADPAFVAVPTDRLLAAAYLDQRADLISPRGTMETMRYGSAAESDLVEDGGTSHISVVDARGMAVACTETINLIYGSAVVVPGFGFALNDEMDDFTTVSGRPNKFGLRQSDRNLPQPGKRPLSSMSPTIVVEHGRAVLVAGGSGGPRIISATVQCVLNCMLFEMPPAQAVGAPRFHHQWLPDVLQFEEAWNDTATVTALETRGHVTGRRDEIGVVQVITVGEDGVHAASDPRKGGAPAGY